ncbi:nucleotide exchange factor GrpE [Actinomadura fibrosa]|uniref:Nucleotide exchange factor GrpE n=1 Tax=Actinomadura fibrosa TaxID=111802 RepID=A0ABW2XE11_9ACTN|nr:nucleotide exchange factor GrpE [Actinomadura fibrosa]
MSRDPDRPVSAGSGARPEPSPGEDGAAPAAEGAPGPEPAESALTDDASAANGPAADGPAENGSAAKGSAGNGSAKNAPAGSEPNTDGETAAFQAELRDAIAGLTARLDREHERAAHREAVIDRLHEENQRLRRGELQQMLEPVRAALYRLHDQARRESGRLAAPDGDPPDPRHAAALLEAVADDVADALARLGVERFRVQPGDPYDAARHRPVAVTSVTEPGRDGTVVTVQSDGFEQGGKVLRKAAVCVGRLGGDGPGAGGPGRNGEAGDAGTAVRAGSSPRRATGRGGTMNTGLGTDG